MPVKTAKKPAPEAKGKIRKTAPKTAKKLTAGDVLAIIAESQKATEKSLEESRKAMEKSIAELSRQNDRTSKIVGRLGNRFGEFAESTLVPDLVAKFKKFGFAFGKMGERIRMDDEQHGIHAEIDAFLENGDQAMAVEVKVQLKSADVEEHIRRMEKIRAYADLHNDNRKFFGAIAATVTDKDVKTYALKQGFYIIEPSGESVKIAPPVSKTKSW